MKYYTCEEVRDRNIYIWSYRANTDEQEILILVDETQKIYNVLDDNKDFISEIIQELKIKGYCETNKQIKI